MGATAVCDVNLIYSRVIGMQQSRDIKFSDVLQCELAPAAGLNKHRQLQHLLVTNTDNNE